MWHGARTEILKRISPAHSIPGDPSAADALKVAHVGELPVFRLGESALDRLFQEKQLALQDGTAGLRQDFVQVFEHRAKATRNLQAVAAEEANLRDRQSNEVLPV